jgi:xanthine/CO dehydrogenase XdhC/CoxF family maturation factor
VGLALNAESPREIALSIIAEVQQFYGRAAVAAQATRA